jgi:hypothetical protein
VNSRLVSVASCMIFHSNDVLLLGVLVKIEQVEAEV